MLFLQTIVDASEMTRAARLAFASGLGAVAATLALACSIGKEGGAMSA